MHNGMFVEEEAPRIIIAKTGALYVSDVTEADGGIYTCAAINPAGEALESTLVKVTGGSGLLDHKKKVDKSENGCADGTVEGLKNFQDVAACEGAWKGHVRKGKTLCAEGWRVCNQDDTSLLRRISWETANGINGCFAYNAANNFGKCTSCEDDNEQSNMGGLGRHCSQRRRARSSCLAEGRIDVYYGKKKGGTPSCTYQAGLTSGVVCCKIVSEIRPKGEPYCENTCENGGICVGFNRCRCNNDWKGALCQIPVCRPGCPAGSICIEPGVCSCSKSDNGCTDGRRSDKDYETESAGLMLKGNTCRRMCLHGGRCERGSCFCPAHTRGRYCQEALVPGVPYDPPKRYNKHNKHRHDKGKLKPPTHPTHSNT
ncbi:uncharacterized protein [Amphiura filiformis]|uniref:uncharacterized protein isoform X2 n=1 Tax=Amphiura filiformis TaxID=82378 RepID=UPI003B2211F8